MKRITKLSFKNLKGRSSVAELAPVTVFVGDSFSGKTTYLDAIKLALLGWHPQIGKRPGDVSQLCKGSGMSVAAQFSDGNEVDRSWWREKNSAKYDGPEKEVVPSLSLDFREFLGLTARERTAYVFAQMDLNAAGLGMDYVASEMRKLTPEVPGPETEAATQECIETVIALDKDRQNEDASMQAWIDAVVEDFREKKKLADAAVKQMAGLMQGGAQLREGAPPQSVETELKAARSAQADKRTTVESLERTLRESAARKQRIAGLQKELATVPDHAAIIAELERKSAEAEQSIKGKSRRTKETGTALTTCASRLDSIKWQLGGLLDDITACDNKHDASMKQSGCPYCKSSRKGWQEHIIEEYTARIAELKAKVKSLEKDRAAAQAELALAHNAHQEAVAESEAIDAAEAVIRDCSTRINNHHAVAKGHNTNRAVLKELQDAEASLTGGEDETLLKLSVQLHDAGIKVGELETKQKQWIAYKAEEVQSLKAQEAARKQKATAEILKLALARMMAIQNEIVAKSIGSLMERANLFTAGILKAPLEFMDGEIGYMDGRQWVSHTCFSGTETALAYAAMAVALAKDAPVRIVMIDELGIMDGGTKAKVVARMQDLTERGVIDQAVMCDSGTPPLTDKVVIVQIEKAKV